MLHLDLFSGIGGFAYAADQVWDDVTHIFCDNEPFAQQVLKKHWPESEIYDDIRQINSDTFNEGLERQRQKQATRQRGQSHRAGKDQESRPFILTGGFPCQPFSSAGVRRGTADERYLWPEMYRVIRLTQPTWVIAENVRGLATWEQGLVLEQICTDLEAAGYEVQPLIIPAVAVNAPHRRDRIWFIGHTKHDGQYAAKDPKGDIKRANGDTARPDELRQPKRANSLREAAADPRRKHGGAWASENPQRQTAKRSSPTEEAEQPGRFSWNDDWHEVAAELCSVDDGLPAELGGLKLSKPQHRAAQLKAYGNAIVPQVAIEIMKSIKEVA